MSCLIDATESARLDDLTRVTSTILGHIHGTDLDAVLAADVKRYGRSDADLRAAALASVHPEDLYAALIKGGYSLARFGIAGLS